MDKNPSATWEERYRQGDTPWDKGNPHPALLQWLKTHASGGRVLVPGCGLGHDVRALAAAGFQATGLDIAPFAIQAAKEIPPIRGEEYLLGDILAPPSRLHGQFDLVFEHTCFCTLPPPRRPDYVESLCKLLKPGTRLLAIFYLNPRQPGGDAPPYAVTPAELNTLFSPRFTILAEKTQLPTYPGREGREILRLLEKRP